MHLWTWLPIAEAAESLRLSKRWIRRCIDAEVFAVVKIDQTEFVWLNDVVIRAKQVGIL